MTKLVADIARSDFDPFEHAVRVDPYPHYARLRRAGRIVRLDEYGIWAVPHHDDIRAIFADAATYGNAGGAGLANLFREKSWRQPSIILEADPPLHTRTRAVLSRILSPSALRQLGAGFHAMAGQLVDRLVEQRTFDAVGDLAEIFPLSVFPDALGLVGTDRKHLLTYGAMVFAGFGPANDYFNDLMARAPVVLPWVAAKCGRDALAPGGFGAKIYEAADAGDLAAEEAPLLVRSFLSAGLDTTISSLGLALLALARHPAQWAILAADPGLARSAFDECLRYDTPAHFVFRTTRTATAFAGVPIGEHEKVLLLLGSANRDPAQWTCADDFDVTRRTAGHLSFGTGIHGCVGQMIARLEGEAVLQALARRVARIEIVGDVSFRASNGLRALATLPVQVISK